MPFRKTDKGPYGTYVLFNQLPHLFPASIIHINHSSPATKFKNYHQNGQGYFIVAPFVEVTDAELQSIRQFVQNGNVLFISTYILDEKIQEWLHVKYTGFVTMNNYRPDSIQALDLSTGEYESFSLGRAWMPHIDTFDSTATDLQILSKYQNGNISSISFKEGDGYVVLHTQPFMFSNYHLIKKRTGAYAELIFSALPGPVKTIYWDEYSKGTARDIAPLRFVMSQPALRNAFWWAFAGLILLVLISFKRKQKAIPVLSPLVNTSLDMVRTVSDMYFFSHKNEVMAKKKIAHWFEYLRTRYNIFTSLPPEAFWQSVKMRSGMPHEKVNELQEMVEQYRNGDVRITDSDLIKLNNLIDSYYKS